MWTVERSNKTYNTYTDIFTWRLNSRCCTWDLQEVWSTQKSLNLPGLSNFHSLQETKVEWWTHVVGEGLELWRGKLFNQRSYLYFQISYLESIWLKLRPDKPKNAQCINLKTKYSTQSKHEPSSYYSNFNTTYIDRIKQDKKLKKL